MKYGKRMLLPSILCLAFILFIFLQQNDSSDSTDELITTIPQEEKTEQLNKEANQEESSTTQKVIVDVKGAVKFPGVYELTAEDRIVDAVQLAGGYTDLANTKYINHAQKLQDEMVIYIPKEGEDLESQLAPMGQAVSLPSPSNSHNNTTSSNEEKVNINTAEESVLTTLPGIGPSKAQAIIAYREENGPFKTVEDLNNVTGIGDKTFEKLKDQISVN